MAGSDDNELTGLLREWSTGDERAADALFALVYQHLKGLARAQLASERPGHTLQPTALVNEAYLKLMRGTPIAWEDRVHFYAVASRVIRQILVDYGRRRRAQRRGGGHDVTLDTNVGIDATDPVDLLALDAALNRLAEINPGQAQIVELRYFGGLTIDEVATATHQSEATVNRQWRAARAWLFKRLGAR